MPETAGQARARAGGADCARGITQGVIYGLYSGLFTSADRIAGFQISETGGTTTIAPLVNGVVSGSAFTPTSGDMYTLRLRIATDEMQRVLQTYNSINDTGMLTYGGTYISPPANLLFEVQDTTGGVAYSGSVSSDPAACVLAILNSSIASIEVSQQGPA